jgi:hypothetical protein
MFSAEKEAGTVWCRKNAKNKDLGKRVTQADNQTLIISKHYCKLRQLGSI